MAHQSRPPPRLRGLVSGKSASGVREPQETTVELDSDARLDSQDLQVRCHVECPMAPLEHDHRGRTGQYLPGEFQLSRHETAGLCAQLRRALHGWFRPAQSHLRAPASRPRPALRLPRDVGQRLHEFEQLHLLRRLQTLQQFHLLTRRTLPNQRTVGRSRQRGLVVAAARHQRALRHRAARRLLLGGGQPPSGKRTRLQGSARHEVAQQPLLRRTECLLSAHR